MSPLRNSGPFYSGLLTDLYELTMAAGYLQNHFSARASFEVFVRHLPEHRSYLVAAGLEQALDFLENSRFPEEEISYLRELPLFRHVNESFFDYLQTFRFSGDVWAMPEGTVFFPGEPILRVTAPIGEAQLMETSLLSAIHLQTLIASKAARVTTAAAGRPVIEFGSRRAHGIGAGVFAARAAFVGGCEGTSNAYAGFRFGIPAVGTQAHSWVMAYDDESEAFSRFLDVFPEQSTLLVDTYDVRAAIEKIIALGRRPHGVRLDSGDVCADSLWIRRRLDEAGWDDVQIFASGDLNEHRIADLLASGAELNSFGVGTALSTSFDSPSVGVIYKLVEVQFKEQVRSTAKFSADKQTYPGRKQVFRFRGDDGKFSHDVIGLEDETFPGAEPLLIQVMRDGRRVDRETQGPAPAVRAARSRFLANRASLPTALLSLEPAAPFPVRYSARIEEMRDQLERLLVQTAPARDVESAEIAAQSTMVFWAVDAQQDFMNPAGRLYVPGAEQIIPNIQRLVEAAEQSRVLLISSADAHEMEDPELSEWRPHCLKGTAGAELIPEARAVRQLVIRSRRGFPLPGDIGAYPQIVLEKSTFEVFDNPNTDALLKRLRSVTCGDETEFVVFGVATEYCVRSTVEGLLRRGCKVTVVSDAIRSFNHEHGQVVLADLKARGAKTLTTEEVIGMADALRPCSADEASWAMKAVG